MKILMTLHSPNTSMSMAAMPWSLLFLAPGLSPERWIVRKKENLREVSIKKGISDIKMKFYCE